MPNLTQLICDEPFVNPQAFQRHCDVVLSYSPGYEGFYDDCKPDTYGNLSYVVGPAREFATSKERDSLPTFNVDVDVFNLTVASVTMACPAAAGINDRQITFCGEAVTAFYREHILGISPGPEKSYLKMPPADQG